MGYEISTITSGQVSIGKFRLSSIIIIVCILNVSIVNKAVLGHAIPVLDVKLKRV